MNGAKDKQERSKIESQLRNLALGILDFADVEGLLDISPNLARLRLLYLEKTFSAWPAWEQDFFCYLKQEMQNIWEQVLQDESSHMFPEDVAFETAAFEDEFSFSAEDADGVTGLERRQMADAPSATHLVLWRQQLKLNFVRRLLHRNNAELHRMLREALYPHASPVQA